MYNLDDKIKTIQKVSFMGKRLAVAFTGPSGSGKTSLIEKISKKLILSQKVAIIKNDPKDKAQFDTLGKDSDLFSKTGAEVIVTSPTRTTYFSQREKTLEDIIHMVNDFDILLVEGLKTLALPRIAIFRNTIESSYFDYSEAIAIDDTITLQQGEIPSHIDILDLNDTTEIIAWIMTHAKTI